MVGRASGRAIPRSALCAGHYARLRSWDDARQCAWHGPWHGTLDNPSTASAVSAIPCVIGALDRTDLRDRDEKAAGAGAGLPGRVGLEQAGREGAWALASALAEGVAIRTLAGAWLVRKV